MLVSVAFSEMPHLLLVSVRVCPDTLGDLWEVFRKQKKEKISQRGVS